MGIYSEPCPFSIPNLNGYRYCGHSTLLGKQKRVWQDVDYVLGYFGDTHRSARTRYFSYVEAGLNQGRRKELTGGGLIRSLGGWSEARKNGLKGRERIKSDERILGESDFVSDVLSQANEAFDEKYELKRLGYDMDRIAGRVAEIFEMEREDVFRKGKHQERGNADGIQGLFCKSRI